MSLHLSKLDIVSKISFKFNMKAFFYRTVSWIWNKFRNVFYPRIMIIQKLRLNIW